MSEDLVLEWSYRCSFPLWSVDKDGAVVNEGGRALPHELEAAIEEWAEEGDRLPLGDADPDPDPAWLADWNGRGEQLASHVAQQLGTAVRYRAWT